MSFIRKLPAKVMNVRSNSPGEGPPTNGSRPWRVFEIEHGANPSKWRNHHDLFFLIPNNNATTTYSGKLFAQGLSRKGYPVKVVQKDEEKKYLLKTLKSGTIIFQKCLHPLHQAAGIRHLKGKVSLIHIDDDWMDMEKKTHIDTLKVSDLILVVSKPHLEALARYTTAPRAVIRTLPDIENYPYYPMVGRRNKPPVIAWQQSCADGYVLDLLSIAKPLKNLHAKYHYRLKLYGWHMGKDYPDRRAVAKKELPFAEYIPYAPLKEYLTRIVPDIRMADIFIVPYRDQPNRMGKGGFALRRMMLLGVPVVVTGKGFHKELIKDGLNGFLANTPEEWQKKLELLITNPSLRKKFSQNGRRLMEEEFGYERCLDLFIRTIKPYIKGV